MPQCGKPTKKPPVPAGKQAVIGGKWRSGSPAQRSGCCKRPPGRTAETGQALSEMPAASGNQKRRPAGLGGWALGRRSGKVLCAAAEPSRCLRQKQARRSRGSRPNMQAGCDPRRIFGQRQPGAALRFLQAGAVPRRKNRLSARGPRPQAAGAPLGADGRDSMKNKEKDVAAKCVPPPTPPPLFEKIKNGKQKSPLPQKEERGFYWISGNQKLCIVPGRRPKRGLRVTGRRRRQDVT